VSKHVLVIEGDDAVAGKATAAIQQGGWAPVLVGDWKEAMEAARRERPDLILLSAELPPPANGYAVFRDIKKDEELKAVPVILMSAVAENIEKHKKLKNRAEDYMIKPFEASDLIDRVKALIGAGETVAEEDAVVELGAPEGDEPLVEAAEEQGALEALGDEPLVAGEVAGDEEPLVEEETTVDTAAAEEVAETPPPQGGLDALDDAFDSLELKEEPAAAPPAPPPPPAEDEVDETVVTHAPDEEALAGLDLEEPPPMAAAAPRPPEPPAEDETVTEDEGEEEHIPDLDDDSTVIGEKPPSIPDEDEEPTRIKQAPEEDLSLAGLDELATETAPAAPSAADTGRIKELEKRAADAEEEAKKYREEVASRAAEAAKARAEADSARRDVENARKAKEEAEKATQQLKDDLAKKEATLKALREKAEQVVATAKKYQTELQTARQELQSAGKAKVEALTADLEKARGENERLEKAVQDLRSAGDAARGELETAQGDAAAAKAQLEEARGEVATLKSDLESARSAAADLEKVRADLEAARAEMSRAQGEADEARDQLKTVKAESARHEERVVKAYQRIKADEKLREKTRKALNIALQLLDEAAQVEESAEQRE
jgi:CheY-like chemotaxis protein